MLVVGEAADVSLKSFILGSAVFTIPVFAQINVSIYAFVYSYWYTIFAGYVSFVFVCIFLLYNPIKDKGQVNLQNANRGAFIGLVFGSGLILTFFSSSSWQQCGWYMCCLAFFHWSEYFSQAMTNPDKLTLASYLLNHSPEYKIAAVVSWSEFLVEYFIAADFKSQFRWISLIGLCMTLAGEILRKVSMFTAGSNFDHHIQFHKRDGHQLVTGGVYNWCRHPSYVGWFYWSVGTQLILCNPLCLIVYTVASWKFFKTRIEIEEATLIGFFGDAYLEYMERVGTGLPFIAGFKLKQN